MDCSTHQASLSITSSQSLFKLMSIESVLQMGFPDGSVDKESTCIGDIGNVGLIPESGSTPGGGNGNPLQYSCLGNPMNRGAWWTPVHGVTRVRHNLVTKPPVLQTSFSPYIFPCHVYTGLYLILGFVMSSVVACVDEHLVATCAAVRGTVHIPRTRAFLCVCNA